MAVSDADLSPARRDFSVAAANPGVARVIVYADLRTGAPGFRAALAAMGEAEPIGQGVWALRTHLSAGEIRTRLGLETHRGDRLFILDATRDRFACLDLGPEIEARLRRLWRP